MAELDPLKMVETDLANPEVEVQLTAVSHLKIVARALGIANTQAQLIPVLEKYCFPPDADGIARMEMSAKEEVTAQIAKTLDDQFFHYVGGSVACGQWMLPLLEQLSTVEETIIRNNAVESMCKCINLMEPAHVATYAHPVFLRLFSKDWFTNKISAAGLTATIYKNLRDPDKRLELLESHKRLIRDEMPLVRSEAFTQAKELIKVCDSSFYDSYGKIILNHLFQETPGANRTIVVDITLTFLIELPKKGLSDAETYSKVWPWIEKISRADSWRIRNEFALKFHHIAESLNKLQLPTDTQSPLLPLFLKSMSDPEPAVRQSIVGVLPKCLVHVPIEDQGEVFCNNLFELASDANQEVREKTSQCFIEAFKASNPQEVDRAKMVDLLNVFKNDESSKVRLNICERIGTMCGLLDSANQAAVFESCQEWQNDSRWRIRAAIVGNIGDLAADMGRDKFDNSFFKEFLLKSFVDPAYNVRTAACEQLVPLSEAFGPEYIEGLIDRLKSVKDMKNYLHRMIVHDIMGALSKILSARRFNDEFVPILLQGLTDPVPNVRLKAAQIGLICVPKLILSSQSAIILQHFENCASPAKESDPDVLYFSGLAWNAMKK